MSTRRITIAIDGPAGAGKSTVAREIAKRLNYVFVDTGAMYRAVTLKVLESGVDPNDKVKVVAIANEISIELLPHPEKPIIKIDGKDRSDDIRKPEVSKNISPISSNPKVRERLVQLQQEFGKKGGVIMDGRDIGTVVFPNAELKIFMLADPTERATRRLKELVAAGNTTQTIQSVLTDIQARDKADEEREVGPLKQASDAVVLDTTKLSKEKAINTVLDLVQQRAKLTAKPEQSKNGDWTIYFVLGAVIVLGLAIFLNYS